MTNLKRICNEVINEYKALEDGDYSTFEFPERADKLARALLVVEEALQLHAKASGYQDRDGWIQVESHASDALAQAEEILK